MTGINKRSNNPRLGQSKIKDYSGWRVNQVDTEMIDGKPERVSKSWPDIEGILDDIRKQPLPKVRRKRK